MKMSEGLKVSVLLLVRNSVDHDARVLRAAKVAGRELPGIPLVVGVATASGSTGAIMMEGIWVVRFAPRPPSLGFVRRAVRLASPRRVRRLSSRRPASEHGAEQALGVGTASLSPKLTLGARARRALSGLSFALQALLLARKVKPSVVHANDWNTMWCGLAIKLTCGSRLVYDSHELWADRNGRWEWRAWLVASEAVFVRVADEVITSSPGYADALATRYRIPRPEVVRNIPESPTHSEVASRPARVLPDGTPNVSVKLPSPDIYTRAALYEPPLPAGPPMPLRIAYIGGLMPGRGLEQMIDALPLIPYVRLCAIGPGAVGYRESLMAHAVSVGVEGRVELRAPVAPWEVHSVLMGAAAGLCLIQPVCRSYELCLPNKLFEYAAAGVPVLASDVPVIAAVVRGEGLGEVVAPTDPHAIAAGLERLLRPERWKMVAERVRGFAAAHDWAGEACALTGVYERAVSELAA
jgi:glycosyltransferase involved in cell wall biosynthesis